MKVFTTSLICIAVTLFTGCNGQVNVDFQTPPMPKSDLSDTEHSIATFGAGCFWCVEAIFQSIDGVYRADSGYMGGHVENPTYRQVTTGETGHAEVIRIAYDPDKITYEALLDWLWRSHDPTTLNRQGADVGTQYRSVIFYHDDAQRAAAVRSKVEAQAAFERPIVTEITQAGTFYIAEDYHQNYFANNENAPYCQVVIRPKLRKLGLE